MPFLLNATWRMKDEKYAEFKRRTHNGSEVAAIRIQNRMVRKAREIAAERTLTGAMQRGIRGVVELTDRGVRVALEDPVWYAHFQDRGTKRGVSPLYFLEQGLAEGKDYALEDLKAGLGKGVV